jgi:hypothetical protein
MTKLIHALNDYVELQHRGKLLFRYNYAPTYDPWESRKPFMHPINTLAGNEITCYRPHDHVWHKGLQMTMAHLSGQNFWGGFSYVRDKGYQKLDNIGWMEHLTWDELTCDGDNVVLRHQLKWITQGNQEWLHEQRQIRLAEFNEKEGYYALDWQMRLKNISNQTLKFGSPTTEGRVNAGYGGLFWRGPRSFTNGQLLAAGNLEGPDTMGKSSPWCAFIGAHDGSADKSTILFIDRAGNPNYPNKWFARTKEFACMAFSFSFDEEVSLEPGKELSLSYRTVFANGDWTRDRIEGYARGK